MIEDPELGETAAEELDSAEKQFFLLGGPSTAMLPEDPDSGEIQSLKFGRVQVVMKLLYSPPTYTECIVSMGELRLGI